MTHLPRLKVIVLISGQGTNLQALIRAQQTGELHSDIRAVFSDRIDAPGLERARQADIDTRHLEPADFDDKPAFDAALAREILALEPELLVLAGFMRVLGSDFVAAFRGRVLNIHPSLLPRFPGLNTHRRVLAAGDTVHGATVHFVTETLDGGPAVIQYRIPVGSDDTEDSLKFRVSRGEHIILPRAVGWCAEQRLRLVNGAVMLDDRELNQAVMVDGEA